MRIRQSLNVESGLNDGIVLPVVLVTASLAGALKTTGEPSEWGRFVAMQIVLGPLAGIAVGLGGGRLIDGAVRRDWVNDPFERLSVLGLAIAAFGGGRARGWQWVHRRVRGWPRVGE